MPRFTDKRVFISGAASGIGYGICKAFCKEGALVVLNDVNAEKATEAAERLNKESGRQAVIPFGADISNTMKIREFIDKFSEEHKGIDIIIANAGITNYGSFLEYTPESFDNLVAVNLKGTYFTAQAGAKAMIKYTTPGKIILMSSVTGITAHANLSAYGATKAAIQLMTKTIAMELGKYQITVNAIAPGATITERTLIDDPAYEKNWKSVTPIGNPATVEDIAGTVLFLASSDANHVTGQTLVVDGGWSLYSPLPSEHPQV